MQPGPGRKPLYHTCTSRCSSRSRSACSSACSSRRRPSAMKPLGDGFIKLIKMMIAPIIFATVVVGIAKMGDMKKVGRVGLKALVYFEVGLDARAGHRPGRGQRRAPGRRDQRRPARRSIRRRSPATPTRREAPARRVGLPADIIPDSVVGRVRQGRDPPGAAVLGPVRPGAARLGEQGRSRWSSCSTGCRTCSSA